MTAVTDIMIHVICNLSKMGLLPTVLPKMLWGTMNEYRWTTSLPRKITKLMTAATDMRVNFSFREMGHYPTVWEIMNEYFDEYRWTTSLPRKITKLMTAAIDMRVILISVRWAITLRLAKMLPLGNHDSWMSTLMSIDEPLHCLAKSGSSWQLPPTCASILASGRWAITLQSCRK